MRRTDDRGIQARVAAVFQPSRGGFATWVDRIQQVYSLHWTGGYSRVMSLFVHSLTLAMVDSTVHHSSYSQPADSTTTNHYVTGIATFKSTS